MRLNEELWAALRIKAMRMIKTEQDFNISVYFNLYLLLLPI